MNDLMKFNKFNGCRATMVKWNEIGQKPQFPAANNGKFEVKDSNLKEVYKGICTWIELFVLILFTYL
jgi:hypothetical protein